MTAQDGFTLIETTIAMVLLAIVGLGVALAFGYAASNTANAADRQIANAVAQQTLEQLRSVPFNDSTLAATSPDGTATMITRAGRLVTVTTTIVDSVFVNGSPTIKTITVRATPVSSNAPWATSATTMFGSVTLVSQRVAQRMGPNRSF